jgi:hypothetical protein
MANIGNMAIKHIIKERQSMHSSIRLSLRNHFNVNFQITLLIYQLLINYKYYLLFAMHLLRRYLRQLVI